MVLRTGGRTGIAHHLHGQPAHEQSVHHRFKGLLIPAACIQTGIPDSAYGIFHDVIDHGADRFTGELMGDPPVGERDKLAEHVPDAAGREIRRSPGDDIEVGDDEKRRHRVHGVLIAVPGHGRDGRAVTVHTGSRRERHKGYPSLRGTVADRVVDGAAAAGQKNFGIR